MSALEARSLSVGYLEHGERAPALADLSLALLKGTIVGLTGESGAGKSTLALALTGFRRAGTVVLAGEVDFGGVDLGRASPATLRRLWGAGIAYLPQDCSIALNPALRLGGQLAETLRTHGALSRDTARARALALLERVGLHEPERLLRSYAGELSGGEQQRVAIALAIACEPKVLILDEPTTGLDGPTEARVMALIASLARELETATLLISHDLALLAMSCDELRVMYGGQIVERGPAASVFSDPRHPYTAALLAAIPTIAGERPPQGLAGSAPLSAVTDRCGFADRCWLVQAPCLAPVRLVPAGERRDVRCVRSPRDVRELPARETPARAPEGGERASALASIAGGELSVERAGAELEQAPVLSAADLSCRYGVRTH